MTRSERREILDFCRRVLTGPDNSSALEAARLIAKHQRPRKPISPRKLEQQKKRLGKMEQTARIRKAVFARARDKCELCRYSQACEMHHLESGIGRRLQKQAVETCMALCMMCHRDYHRDPWAFFTRIQEWASEYGYPMPSRFSRKRVSP